MKSGKYLKISEETARQAINRVASTDDGKILLYMLQEECGFMRNLMSSEDPHKTQVFAAKRGVYAKFRQYIRPEHLKSIEYDVEIARGSK